MENIQSWDTTANPQGPGKVTMGLTHDYTISVVKEIAGGGRELALEFTAQKMFYQMGEIPVLNFDSAQPPSQDAGNPVAPILRRLVGSRVHLTTDVRGRVIKIDGFNELRMRMAAGAQPQVRAMLEGMFNEVNLGQLCSFAAALQPDDPVKIGDTWPVHLEMPDPAGLMVINLNCAFKDWESQGSCPCARVEFQGNITSKTPENAKPAAYKIEGGTISGKAWFDPALGMLANSATVQHMTMNAIARGKTIATQFNLTLNFRLLKTTDSIN